MINVAISALYVGAEWWTLESLAQQTYRDFRVMVIDPGLDPDLNFRLGAWEMANRIPVMRIPYKSAPGGRLLDWAQWNTPFLLAESNQDFILRLQSFRIIPENFLAQLASMHTNVGFLREVVNVTQAEAMAMMSRSNNQFTTENNKTLDGAAGDWMIRVEDFIRINGIDEPLTMLFHFEDVDMEYRWRTALRQGIVHPATRLRGLMKYASNASRIMLNRPEMTTGKYDIKKAGFQPVCEHCQRQWGQMQDSNKNPITKADFPHSEPLDDMGTYFGKHWFICRKCDAPIAHYGCPHYTVNNYGNEYRATIGLDGKWGRNLTRARAKALAIPVLSDRLKYVRDSYTDPEVLQP